MDTSKEYIKMCEKAKKIRKQWRPKKGDYVFSIGRGGIGIVSSNWSKEYKWFHIGGFQDKLQIKDFILLLRQDQSQEIIIKLYEDYQLKYKREVLNWMLNSFGEFVTRNVRKSYNSNEGYPGNLQTMEQLWLAFVEKEKYNKIWNGKDWVKEI